MEQCCKYLPLRPSVSYFLNKEGREETISVFNFKFKFMTGLEADVKQVRLLVRID
jgi:hypothetical protein